MERPLPRVADNMGSVVHPFESDDLKPQGSIKLSCSDGAAAMINEEGPSASSGDSFNTKIHKNALKTSTHAIYE